MHDLLCAARGLSPLAIVLPQPPLSRLRTRPPNTPRTPSSRLYPIPLFVAPNRNSTDSWNSSNGHDEIEYDWKPDQIRLLTRTLDALPPHLLTPFAGPTPPANLLDKIAHGVASAKGPLEWPHSIRATRAKLIQLSRGRVKDSIPLVSAVSHVKHTDNRPRNSRNLSNTPQNTTTPLKTLHLQQHHPKRPLYRQSSMDFITADELKENNDIAPFTDRLSSHLGSHHLYHPYSRPGTHTHTSPRSLKSHRTRSAATATSSSTLNTLSSFSAHHRPPSTASTMTTTSASSVMSAPAPVLLRPSTKEDPRLARVRRSTMDKDMDCPSTPPPKNPHSNIDFKLSFTQKEDISVAGVKRPPSFGTLAQEIKRGQADVSSDEEERMRTMSAKKKRVKGVVGLGLGRPSTVACSASGTPVSGCPLPKNKLKKTRSEATSVSSGRVAKKPTGEESKDEKEKTRPPLMNPRRNPSMFGSELRAIAAAGEFASPSLSDKLASPPANPTLIPESSQIAKKTLRRVKRLKGRRISFGGLVKGKSENGEDADGEEDDVEDQKERYRSDGIGRGLGSAFQMC